MWVQYLSPCFYVHIIQKVESAPAITYEVERAAAYYQSHLCGIKKHGYLSPCLVVHIVQKVESTLAIT